MTAPSSGCVRQPSAPVNAAPLHGICSFQAKLNLLRGVACQVRRTLADLPALRASSLLRRVGHVQELLSGPPRSGSEKCRESYDAALHHEP